MTKHIRDDVEPPVSAVIPAYNAAGTIKRAIDSIYAQTYAGPIEIVVVDDGSKDETAEIVRKAYPDVKVVQQENRGLSGARNTGVRAASHDVIAFLDSDDEWHPEKIESQVKLFHKLPPHSVVFVGGRVMAEPSCPSYDRLGMAKQWISEWFRYKLGPTVIEIRPVDIVREGIIVGASLLLPRELFDRTGGYDETIRVSEDYPFVLSLAASGAILWLIRQPLYLAYAHPDSLYRSAEAGGSIARIQAFARFDPRNGGAGSRLFTSAEFDDAFQVRLLIEAIAHVDHGLADEGSHLLQLALERGDFESIRTRVLRFGAVAPKRLRVLVWGLRRLGLLRL